MSTWFRLLTSKEFSLITAHPVCIEETCTYAGIRARNGNFRLICRQRNKHGSGFVTENVNNRLVKHVTWSTRGLNASRTGSYIRRILNSRTGVHRDLRASRDNHRIPGANWAIVFADIYNTLNALALHSSSSAAIRSTKSFGSGFLGKTEVVFLLSILEII